MADSKKYTIEVHADTKRIREMARETKRIDADLNRTLKKGMTARDKFDTDSHKDFVKNSKKKEKHYNTELKHSQKMSKMSKTQARDDMRGFDTMNRKKKQEQERDQRTFKKMMGDFSRSPVGKFMTGPQGRVGRGVGRAGKGALRGAVGVGGGLMGMLMGASTAGYARLGQYAQTLAGVSGMAPGGTVKRGMGRRMGASLGYNLVESAQHARSMGRATGVVGPRELQQTMRSTGMDAGETSGIFGALAQGGVGFEGRGGDAAGTRAGRQSKGGKEMQRMISAGMASGLKRGRLPEFFQGVTSLMKEQQRISVGNVGSSDYAKTMAMFGQSGKSGMQGARGAAVLGKLQHGIQKPGGGEAGQALMMQSMGFGKPGGNTGFYEAEKMREQGATGGNLMKVMSEVQKQFGTGKEAALTMREVFGVSLEQAEELLKIYDSSASAEEKLAKIDKTMDKSKTLEQQSLAHLKTTAGMASRMAARFDISIGHGAKAAKYIEKMEDWQFKLVEYMFKAVDYLEKIYSDVKLAVTKWLGGKDAASAARSEEAKLITKQARNEKDLFKRNILFEKAARKYKAAGNVKEGDKGFTAFLRSSALGGATESGEAGTLSAQEADAYKGRIRTAANAQYTQGVLATGTTSDPTGAIARRSKATGFKAEKEFSNAEWKAKQRMRARLLKEVRGAEGKDKFGVAAGYGVQRFKGRGDRDIVNTVLETPRARREFREAGARAADAAVKQDIAAQATRVHVESLPKYDEDSTKPNIGPANSVQNRNKAGTPKQN